MSYWWTISKTRVLIRKVIILLSWQLGRLVVPQLIIYPIQFRLFITILVFFCPQVFRSSNSVNLARVYQISFYSRLFFSVTLDWTLTFIVLTLIGVVQCTVDCNRATLDQCLKTIEPLLNSPAITRGIPSTKEAVQARCEWVSIYHIVIQLTV